MTKEEHEGLNARQGKLLRFIVGRSHGVYQAPVVPQQTINQIEWSDLPHSASQAMFAFKKLKSSGLIVQDGTGYQATQAGMELIKTADKNHWWQRTDNVPVAAEWRK